MRLIPIDPEGLTSFDQITDLDGVNYLFRFSWNRYSSTYTMGLYLPDGTPIVHDVRMICNVPLLLAVTENGRPDGELFLMRDDESLEPPQLKELGAVAKLYYLSKGET